MGSLQWDSLLTFIITLPEYSTKHNLKLVKTTIYDVKCVEDGMLFLFSLSLQSLRHTTASNFCPPK